jgi:hypothetical protein
VVIVQYQGFVGRFSSEKGTVSPSLLLTLILRAVLLIAHSRLAHSFLVVVQMKKCLFPTSHVTPGFVWALPSVSTEQHPVEPPTPLTFQDTRGDIQEDFLLASTSFLKFQTLSRSAPTHVTEFIHGIVTSGASRLDMLKAMHFPSTPASGPDIDFNSDGRMRSDGPELPATPPPTRVAEVATATTPTPESPTCRFPVGTHVLGNFDLGWFHGRVVSLD